MAVKQAKKTDKQRLIPFLDELIEKVTTGKLCRDEVQEKILENSGSSTEILSKRDGLMMSNRISYSTTLTDCLRRLYDIRLQAEGLYR